MLFGMFSDKDMEDVLTIDVVRKLTGDELIVNSQLSATFIQALLMLYTVNHKNTCHFVFD